jgi:hypothetical protein
MYKRRFVLLRAVLADTESLKTNMAAG